MVENYQEKERTLCQLLDYECINYNVIKYVIVKMSLNLKIENWQKIVLLKFLLSSGKGRQGMAVKARGLKA